MKIINFLRGCAFVPVFKVTYAPADSKRPELPIQTYKILQHPRNMAWRSKVGNRLFTAVSANERDHFISFRADRVLSVNFAGVSLVGPKTFQRVKSTLQKKSLEK
jgi:hypothetical protein